MTVVGSAQELAEAVAGGARVIEVKGTISGSPMITLPAGTTLRGGTLEFGAKGVRLTRDNTLDGVTIRTTVHEPAVLNDTSLDNFGTLTLRNVTTSGQVLPLAEERVRAGHIQIDGLTITQADVRGRTQRPHGFGVDALQGALTVWNRQPDREVVITAEVLDVAVGSEQTPARGSGVFLGGHGNWAGQGDGGVLRVTRLTTGEVHTDGGIAAGTPADLRWRVRHLRRRGRGRGQPGAGHDVRAERHGAGQLGPGAQLDRRSAGVLARPERHRLRQLRRRPEGRR